MKAMVNGIPLAWEEAGSGPAVLLIHGFPLNRHMWRPQMMRLIDEGYRVVAPDLRGFGESGRGDGPVTISTFGDDIIALMDLLAIERAIIGGMSMGGYVLLDLLERRPERVEAALFVVTRSGADDRKGRRERTILAREVNNIGPEAAADVFVKSLFTPQTLATRPALAAEVRGWMADVDPKGLADGLIAMRDRADFCDRLPRFALPSLVVGAEMDEAVPLEEIRMFAERLPRCRSCIIPGAGHMVNLERPEEFNDCLMEFLDEVREGMDGG